MIQILPVGNGVLLAFNDRMPYDRFQEFSERLRKIWEEKFPDVPLIALSESRVVQRGETILFEFTGEVSPTVVAEFQRWWEEVNVDR